MLASDKQALACEKAATRRKVKDMETSDSELDGYFFFVTIVYCTLYKCISIYLMLLLISLQTN